MKTPVIIAARNEAEYIGRTLHALNNEYYEPIVAINDSQDSTADIAHSFGATVHVFEEPGKLPAIQKAIARLIGYRALEPLLLTDADSRPLFPALWSKVMLHAVSAKMPNAATGPVGYIDGKLQDKVFNTYSLGKAALAGKLHNQPFTTGNNMAVSFYNQRTLDEFMAMPHIWCGDDAAIAKMISLNGGTVKQLIDPRSYVLTSTRYAITLKERLELGAHGAWDKHMDRYRQRAPANSRSFRPKSNLGY